MSERIALLTYKEEPNLTDAETLLPSAFAKAGIDAIPVPWDGVVKWDNFNTLILRACWNYHLKKDEFIQFLEGQIKNGRTIWNPIEVIKWNTDKHYLLDMERKGVKIIPTTVLEIGDKRSLSSILKTTDWHTGIVKPTIGASAYEVHKFNLETAPGVEERLDRTKPWLIQKFCPEINDEGEYSLIFFNKKYSHAVLKNPKNGDYRTQPHYGGTEHKVDVDDKIIDQTKYILSKVDNPLLYARIDGVLVEGEFRLMELELTEPYLFLDSHPEAPKRFVEAYKNLNKE